MGWEEEKMVRKTVVGFLGVWIWGSTSFSDEVKVNLEAP